MKIECVAFKDGSPVDPIHTCTGENISPALDWLELPPGTLSLVLLLEDPDAPGGTFLHWSLYALDPTLGGLPGGLGRESELAGIGKQGRNSFGRTGYDGPCPPPGSAHRYYLRLLALDILPGLPPGAPINALKAAMQDHILDQASTYGTFKRT